LPDFSYAGYANGERQPDTSAYQLINVAQHGIVADDGLDDSQALIALLETLKSHSNPVIVQATGNRLMVLIIRFGTYKSLLKMPMIDSRQYC
jgi:hypothetical protein